MDMVFVRWGVAVMSVGGMAGLMQYAWYHGFMEAWVWQNKRRRRVSPFKLFNGKVHFGYIALHALFIGVFSFLAFGYSVERFVQGFMLLSICCISVHIRFEGRPPA
jgi:hypothetical protein